LVQKAENIRIIVSNEPFEEKCDLPRSHAIRHDQQNKEMSSQRIEKDKIKDVIALINDFKVQDAADSDDELNTPTISKTAVVCELAQVTPEIMMTKKEDDNKKRP
jgi:hypothetical protein